MKKFLAMLVAAMMVLSLVAIPVLADGEVVFAVENAPATATPGTEITVNLTVNGTFEAHVLNMQFNYNADAFEYVSHTRGDVLNQIIDLGGTQLVDATTIPGSMRLGVMMPTAAFTQSGTICSVTLRVKEGAANGASDLALVITEFKNFPTGGQATPIANVVNNATVTITGGSEPTPVPPTEEPTPTQNPNTPAPGGMATISLTAGDVFSDGSGYQMLLDADATAFGNEIPAEGPLTQGGDAPAGLYDAFEYKIPVNADGSTTTSNIVINNTITIEVPAGTYDWCITNPTPGDRIWIASNQGNVGGRADDYEFEAGYTYNFTVYLLGQNDATDVEIIEGGGSTPNTPVPPTENPNTPEPGTATGWGFETDPFAEGWTIRDDDGDGYNWEWMDASGSNYNVYEGTHCMASASFQNNPFGGGTALNPDNWLISPAFTAGSTVTFWYAGQDPNYAAEPFGVYVIANGTTSDELGHFTASNTYQQGSVDISAYAGETVQVAFRHYGITDMFRLNLDLVEVSGGGSTPNTPVPPTENPNTPEPGTATGWGFETDPFAEGWTIRDDDGDGYNWEWMDASGSNYNVYEGTHCMASASFQNNPFGGGTALNPDNWLISPAFTAGSTVTFWYAGQDPNYAAETFGVYVIANGTTSDELAYFTASNTYQQGSVDISDFAGQTVQVAFRHYDITDMFRLNLDLVEADAGGSIPNTPVPPTDAPITEAPITEAPITEAPITEAPITEAPITEAPITEAPITDEPVTPAPGDVIFSVGGVHYVAAGSQVSVDLTIDGEYEANGMNIWVQYDAEKLTLNSVDEGEIMKAIKDLGGMNILDFQSIPGSVRLGSMLPTDPVSGSGKIFTMNFTVAEGLEDGTEMPIEILVKEFFNMPVGGENTPIAFFAENGSIVVGSEPIVTDEPGVTDEPTAVPTDAPNPPITGAMSLIGVGIAAIVASAGVVIFRKKEED